jgi:hypothetical protein
VKANQPTLRADIEACFNDAPPQTIASHVEHDKGHGRIERREVSVIREVDWLSGDRRFPGELRLPNVTCLVKVHAEVERGGQPHSGTRYYISSAALDAARAAQAVRGHWGIENRLHWGPRRHIQGGPVPPAQRLWCPQHGRRAAFRAEPRAHRRRQEIPQAAP